MNSKRNAVHIVFLLILCLLALSALAAYTPGAITSDLPPRPTVAATPASAPAPVGAYIRLYLPSTLPLGPQGVWTVVQWQDASGDWHDVTGWQGTVELDGAQTWWVAPEDLATGPFRWVVYDAPAGDLVAISHSFNLPENTNEVVPVEVQPDPKTPPLN